MNYEPRPIATLRHLAQNEHFLEHERREWLRLLLDTEWFLQFTRASQPTATT